MRLDEAYKLLELSEDATPDDAKKQFRKMAATLHPDVNKAPDAEEKFKQINEAYECVKNGRGSDREGQISYDDVPFDPFFGGNPFGGSPFGNMQQHQNVIQTENIEVHIPISFKESVLGCKKEVKYKRNAKCNECKGTGNITKNNGCQKCGGKGRFIQQQRGMVIMQVCDACHGRTNSNPCSVCSGKCYMQADISLSVTVPPGIIDGNILRIQGKGNFAGPTMFGDGFTDLFCHMHVTQEEGLHIEGNNVVSTLNISLLEALRGSTHSIKTIFGNRQVTVSPQTKHRDEILVPGCGVGGRNPQRVIINIDYPKNLDKLINALSEV
jgi:molecular chaperone DnaJ